MEPRLRPLEWFGLVSGIIGLAADILSLMTLATKWDTKAASGSISTWITAVWALVLIGILYTTVITGFYARRFGRLRHQQRSRSWLSRDREKIEKGSRILSFLIGAPLIVAYFTMGTVAAFSIRKDVSPMDLVGIAILGGVPIGGLASLIIFELNDGAMHLYTLFDPSYNETSDGNIDERNLWNHNL